VKWKNDYVLTWLFFGFVVFQPMNKHRIIHFFVGLEKPWEQKEQLKYLGPADAEKIQKG
jgi:hypothetical protein